MQQCIDELSSCGAGSTPCLAQGTHAATALDGNLVSQHHLNYIPYAWLVCSLTCMQGRVTVGHIAARNGHVQVLGVLASHGFDLNSDTLDMTTLLHEAAQHGHVAAVAWLLKAGVNTGVRNFDGKTAQDLARAEQHHTVVQLLQQAAANSNGQAGSAGNSGQSTPTAAAVAAAAPGGSLLAAGPQQQQHQQQWQVYPENEQYKNYPSFNRTAV